LAEPNDPARDTFDDTWTADRSDDSAVGPLLSSSPRTSAADQGPCLYLGPSGQRCGRRALEGGYCASHRPGAISLPKVALSKKTLAAIIGVVAIVWPYIAELVREIVRWMHSH
jgi:hypothetical protein